MPSLMLNGQAIPIPDGATILDAQGGIDHAGAFVRRPDAEGIHVTTAAAAAANAPHAVDYVTGAVMAISRPTWDAVGRFDEGYYPAYYEDCDYCYRASARGIRSATGERSSNAPWNGSFARNGKSPDHSFLRS